MSRKSNAWRKIQEPQLTWGQFLENITRDSWWGSMTKQVRNDLGTPIVMRDYFGPGRHMWAPTPNIWVKTENGSNVVVSTFDVERKHVDGKVKFFVTLGGPMGSTEDVRVTKWKVAKP